MYPVSSSGTLLYIHTFNNVQWFLTITTFWTNSANNKLMIFFFLHIFPCKYALAFYANCLLRRQFAWNAKTCFSGKKEKIFQNVLKFLSSTLSIKSDKTCAKMGRRIWAFTASSCLKTLFFSSPVLCSGWAIVITFRPPCVRPLTFSNDFSSEATEPILLKFHMEPP